MIRLLTAFALSICLAAPAKALVLDTGDFVDFRADISGVPETDGASEYIVFEVLFSLDPTGALGGSDGLVRFETDFGRSLGGSDIGGSAAVPFEPSRISVPQFAVITPAAVGVDDIFIRLLVTDGRLDLIGTTANYDTLFTNSAISLDVTQVSAVPLPASLVFLLSGLGAIGLIGRRRRAA